jgi:hypothetical protein
MANDARRHVLAVGLDPACVEIKDAPQLTPELVRAFIDAELDRVRGLGYFVDSCLIDLGETADTVLAGHLQSQQFDCVVIGAGLRAPERVLLFERVINLVHAWAPRARICFNTTPADTAEAVRRVIAP